MAKVAFVLADDFEDSEFKIPYDRIAGAGHQVTVVGLEAGKQVRGKRGEVSFTPDKAPDQVSPGDFDALVVPGGYSPDKRTDDGVVEFTRGFFDADKPLAAICHAGSLVVEADAARGRTVTAAILDRLKG